MIPFQIIKCVCISHYERNLHADSKPCTFLQGHNLGPSLKEIPVFLYIQALFEFLLLLGHLSVQQVRETI